MREAVYAHVDRLLEVLPAAPAGDARFGVALETAFALARDRSAQGSGDGGEPRRPARSRHRARPPAARPGGRGEAGRRAVRARLAGARGHDPARPRRLDAPLHGERRAHRGLRGRPERRGRPPQGGARRRRRQRVLLRRPAGRPRRHDLRDRGHARRGVRRRHAGEPGRRLPRGRLLPAGRRPARGHPRRRAAVALRRAWAGRSTAAPPRRSSGASPPAPPSASRPCARSRPSSTVGTRRKKGRRRRSPCSPPPRRRAPASRRPSGTASSTRPGGRASCSRSRGARTATAGPRRRSRPSAPRATRSRRCSPSACASTPGRTLFVRVAAAGRAPCWSYEAIARRLERTAAALLRASARPAAGRDPLRERARRRLRRPRLPRARHPGHAPQPRDRPETPRLHPRPPARQRRRGEDGRAARAGSSARRGPAGTRSFVLDPARSAAGRGAGARWPRRWRASPRRRSQRALEGARAARPSTSRRPSCSPPAAPACRRASCTPASRSSRSASRARRAARGGRGRGAAVLPAALPHVRPLPRDARGCCSGAGRTSSPATRRSRRWHAPCRGAARPASSASRAAGRSCASGASRAARADEALRAVVGDRLRWGLSAAGHLDPAVFRYFQRHGVELCSGFGMTEGTGGITMTPPGGVRGRLGGRPAPGIEARLGADRRAARSPGPTWPTTSTTPRRRRARSAGSPTGDIFVRRPSGHFEIVDRVKDVYKNTRGQTVAPAAVERRLADVPGVKRAFLVGDGRDHNALLIVPDRADPALAGATPEGEEAYFWQLVAAVNRDVATARAGGELRPPRPRLRPGARADAEGHVPAQGDRARLRRGRRLALPLGRGGDPAAGRVRARLPRWFFRDLGLLETGHRRAPRRAPREALGARARGGPRRRAGHGARRGPRVPGRRGRRGPRPLRPPADAVGRQPVAARLRAVQGRLGRAARARLAAGACCRRSGVRRRSRARARHAGARRRRCGGARAERPRCSSREGAPRSRRSRQLATGCLTPEPRLGWLVRRRLEALAWHPDLEVRCLAYRTLLLDEPLPGYGELLASFVGVRPALPHRGEHRGDRARAARAAPPRGAARAAARLPPATSPGPRRPPCARSSSACFDALARGAACSPAHLVPVRAELAAWALFDAEPALAARRAGRARRARRAGAERASTARARARPAARARPEEEERPSRRCSATRASWRSRWRSRSTRPRRRAGRHRARRRLGRRRSPRRSGTGSTAPSFDSADGRHRDLLLALRGDVADAAVEETMLWMTALGDPPGGAGRRAPLRLRARRPRRALHGLLQRPHRLGEASGPWRRRASRARRRPPRRGAFLFVRGPGRLLRRLARERRADPARADRARRTWPCPRRTTAPTSASSRSPAGAPYEGPALARRADAAPLLRAGRRALPGAARAARPAVDLRGRGRGARPRGRAQLPGRAAAGREPAGRPGGAARASAGPRRASTSEPLALAARSRATPLARRQPEGDAGRPPPARGPDAAALRPRGARRDRALSPLPPHLLRRRAAGRHGRARPPAGSVSSSGRGEPATRLVELSELQSALAGRARTGVPSASSSSRARRRCRTPSCAARPGGAGVVISHVADSRGGRYTVREPTGPAEVGRLYRLLSESGLQPGRASRHLVLLDAEERVVGGITWRTAAPRVAHVEGLVLAPAAALAAPRGAARRGLLRAPRERGLRRRPHPLRPGPVPLRPGLPRRPPLGRARALPRGGRGGRPPR